MSDGTPISYKAATRGTPVLSTSGTKIGTLQHVQHVEELDIFDGIVIGTGHGIRFVDADHSTAITTTQIQTSLSDEEATQLAPPSGPPVYHVDALAGEGHDLRDVVGRIFGRAHWTRDRE
jgi:hypothetical protein